LIEDSGIKVKLNPAVKRFLLKIPKPTLENPMADFERILTTFKKSDFGDIDIDYDILKSVPQVLRKNDDVSFTLLNKRIIGIESGKKRKFYGAAVDIGTTTMVLYLIDLSNGHVVNIASAMNPQIPYGEDVISRITFCVENGPQKLQGLAIDKINNMIKQACSTTNVDTNDIFELSIVGNTAMHHLFLGFNSKYLTFSPYVPVIRRSINLKAKELGIDINPCGNVYVLPIVAGFVGADHIGFILSAGIYKSEKIILGIDIGTNGEIVLGNKKKMICCSCAAGPALEGAGISFGMRATDGAIERVKIDKENVKVKVIGNKKPIGICGSGIIDAISEMLKSRIADSTGRINEDSFVPRTRKDGSEFVLVWASDSGNGEDIVITQKDIRNVQLAKAAIAAGINILLKKYGITKDDIEEILIAGAFGSYINPESARNIGLYPNVPCTIKSVGNAAGAGAKATLISKDLREDVKLISQNIEYVELAAESSFEEEFLNAMIFPDFFNSSKTG
ncbi:MAG: ASKHA domain-containing protein, partial [Candidatus Methanofastidiosia archaeon]